MLWQKRLRSKRKLLPDDFFHRASCQGARTPLQMQRKALARGVGLRVAAGWTNRPRWPWCAADL